MKLRLYKAYRANKARARVLAGFTIKVVYIALIFHLTGMFI